MPDERHTASRTIIATPRAIFRAHLDREVIGKWRPPPSMRAEIYRFDPRPGGGYRMAFIHDDGAGNPGKSDADRDIFSGRYIELLPDERIVEEVEFETKDPAFAGKMRITTVLAPVNAGTKVMVSADNVPPGISAEDHRAGMEASLKNLAMLLE